MKHIPGLLDAVEYFYGITFNPLEAGFITPKGEYLDFSGRHLNGVSPKSRDIPHKCYLGTNYFNGYSLEKDHPELNDALEFDRYLMNQTGCVRVNRDDYLFHNNYASFTRKLTDAQVNALANMFLGKELLIEYSFGLCDGDGTIINNLRKKELQEWVDSINQKWFNKEQN